MAGVPHVQVPEHEISEDCQEDLLIAPMGLIQRDPLLWQLQAAIEAADDAHVRSLLAVRQPLSPTGLSCVCPQNSLRPSLNVLYASVQYGQHQGGLAILIGCFVWSGTVVCPEQ